MTDPIFLHQSERNPLAPDWPTEAQCASGITSLTTFSDLAGKLRRAAKNGTRLHLDEVHVKALLSPRIYGIISNLEAEELNALCDQDNMPVSRSAPPQLRVISSESTGCGTGRTGTTGPSAGTRMEAMGADVALAASRLASEAVKKVSRRKLLRTP